MTKPSEMTIEEIDTALAAVRAVQAWRLAQREATRR